MVNKKPNKEQKKLSDFITQVIEPKKDFIKYGEELGRVMAAYPTTEQMVRVLKEHAPLWEEGIYLEVKDEKRNKIRTKRITKEITLFDDITNDEIITKTEIIPRRARKSKWFKYHILNKEKEIKVPSWTKSYRLFVKRIENKEKESSSTKEGQKEATSAA